MHFEIFKILLVSKKTVNFFLIIHFKFVLKIILTFGFYTPIFLSFVFSLQKQMEEKSREDKI